MPRLLIYVGIMRTAESRQAEGSLKMQIELTKQTSSRTWPGAGQSQQSCKPPTQPIKS